eukprot:TRINITY_DN8831_c0_g1_i1.p1 TRINITY_DN8831_c0_g1~~TRINITY_DN8831_c0_g1_i1.p1  ORF type:complete len:1016 (+),score=240.62 TRINITY_DN8831_c0_g1_i1:1061-4108(+)
MTPGFTDDLQEVSDARKTAIIDMELNRLQMDIVALQETRLSGTGSVRERDFSFFWQGKPPDETREHGVGFAVRNSLLGSITPPTEGTERILSLKLHSSAGPVSLFSIYAPTLTSSADVKDKFYDDLSTATRSIPANEPLFILGDFNARVGADHNSWPTCLGQFGTGRMNENGQRLLELCCHHGLCVSNTFFKTKPQHRVSWRHPRSKHWHQLDLILTRRSNLNTVKLTRSYQSADCDTDHSLVCSKVKLQARKLHHLKKEGRPRIDTSKTHIQDKVEEFACALEKSLPGPPNTNAVERWEHFRDAVYNAAMSTFGKKTSKSADWFEAHSAEMTPVIEEKRLALAAYKACPSEQNLQVLRAARSKVQQSARRCANSYWLQLCSQIQVAADTGNTRGMYDGIKQALGPTQKKTAPLKSTTGELIQDRAQQMERWVEHYSELYARENMVTEDALDAIECLPVLEELDGEPSLEEISEALDSLASGRAPGKDGIPAEVLKCCKATIITELHEILCLCWRKGEVPQDMRDANIVTLYKNKGDRSDCNNYRGISLLSIVGKLFARVALKRLQVIAERVYPESQCGFRANRSTIDMVFSLRQLQEKCKEQRRPLFIAFIDLTKAFDLVSRDGLFRILHKIGCPPRLLSIIRSFHKDMKGTVVFDGSTSNSFDVLGGVKQGCVLAPTLFGMFFAVLLKHAFGSSTEGVYLRTRSDGKLFNLSRLRAMSKVQLKCLRDFLFADDAAITTHSAEELQQLMNRFSEACHDFGLTISLKKTKIMGQDMESQPHIRISDHELDVVHDFEYLGSTITDSLSLDTELNKRIGKAATTMSRLTKRVWNNSKLKEHTKVQVYKACIVSTLLYGSESWTLRARQERKLNSFHMRCLRRILNITWQDKVSNSTVLERAGTPSMFTLLKQRRMRWLGHVVRMADGRIPRDLLYGELAQGKRPTGRPHLRFKDVCKRDLKALGINLNTWEAEATDRSSWRQTVRKGLCTFEETLVQQSEAKRQRRKLQSQIDRSSS